MKEPNWEEFTINVDKGTPLKLDKILDEPDITAALIESFHRAESEAIRNNIANNSILLNSEFNLTKSFYFGICDHVVEVPPMILGKSVYLDTDKILPNNVAFALFKSNKKSDEYYRNLLKKYVKTDGKSLRFKNISYKKNKEDFEFLMSIIGEENY